MLRRSIFRLITATGKFIQFQASNLIESYAIRYPANKPLDGQIPRFDGNDGQIEWSDVVSQILTRLDAAEADIIALQSGGGGQTESTFYQVLASLNPDFVVKMTNTSGGTFSGNYTQNQDSGLTIAGEKATLFNGGAVTLGQQLSNPNNFTFTFRFKAPNSATGGLFGFSDRNDPGTNGFHDRSLYFDSLGRIAFYIFPGYAFTLTTQNSYKDGQWHTLTLRMSQDKTTAIFIDGVKVVESQVTGGFNYSGWFKIGWTNQVGLANGITLQGCHVFLRGLTDAEIIASHEAVS